MKRVLKQRLRAGEVGSGPMRGLGLLMPSFRRFGRGELSPMKRREERAGQVILSTYISGRDRMQPAGDALWVGACHC